MAYSTEAQDTHAVLVTLKLSHTLAICSLVCVCVLYNLRASSSNCKHHTHIRTYDRKEAQIFITDTARTTVA